MKKIFDEMEEAPRTIVYPMLDELVYLETYLLKLRDLPQLVVDPRDLSKQRTTTAAKMYKEMLQQYNGLTKTLLTALGRNVPEEESPLAGFVSAMKQDE